MLRIGLSSLALVILLMYAGCGSGGGGTPNDGPDSELAGRPQDGDRVATNFIGADLSGFSGSAAGDELAQTILRDILYRRVINVSASNYRLLRGQLYTRDYDWRSPLHSADCWSEATGESAQFKLSIDSDAPELSAIELAGSLSVNAADRAIVGLDESFNVAWEMSWQQDGQQRRLSATQNYAAEKRLPYGSDGMSMFVRYYIRTFTAGAPDFSGADAAQPAALNVAQQALSNLPELDLSSGMANVVPIYHPLPWPLRRFEYAWVPWAYRPYNTTLQVTGTQAELQLQFGGYMDLSTPEHLATYVAVLNGRFDSAAAQRSLDELANASVEEFAAHGDKLESTISFPINWTIRIFNYTQELSPTAQPVYTVNAVQDWHATVTTSTAS